MKFGKVLTYKDIDEAEKLIGKKVIPSDTFREIETKADALASRWGRPVILTGVVEGKPFPFRVSNGTVYQFIREVIDDEPRYEPYDLSDPKTFDIEVVGYYEPYDLSDKKVRDSLRGRWFRNEYDNEVPVRDFYRFKNRSVWYVNGYSSKIFLEKCKWLDGTPCGRRIDKEMSSPVLTRDGKEDEK